MKMITLYEYSDLSATAQKMALSEIKNSPDHESKGLEEESVAVVLEDFIVSAKGHGIEVDEGSIEACLDREDFSDYLNDFDEECAPAECEGTMTISRDVLAGMEDAFAIRDYYTDILDGLENALGEKVSLKVDIEKGTIPVTVSQNLYACFDFIGEDGEKIERKAMREKMGNDFFLFSVELEIELVSIIAKMMCWLHAEVMKAHEAINSEAGIAKRLLSGDLLVVFSKDGHIINIDTDLLDS